MLKEFRHHFKTDCCQRNKRMSNQMHIVWTTILKPTSAQLMHAVWSSKNAETIPKFAKRYFSIHSFDCVFRTWTVLASFCRWHQKFAQSFGHFYSGLFAILYICLKASSELRVNMNSDANILGPLRPARFSMVNSINTNGLQTLGRRGKTPMLASLDLSLNYN